MVTCKELQRRRFISLKPPDALGYLARLVLVSMVLLLGVLLPQSAYADCGNIIGPEDLFSDWMIIETVPISNCVNPFEALKEDQPYTISIEGQQVAHGAEIIIEGDGTTNYAPPTIDLKPFGGTKIALYRHDGADYEYLSMREVEPGESDFRLLASLFFDSGVDVEPYVQQVMGNNVPDNIPFDWDLYDEFQNYVYSKYVYARPVLLPGTYTFLSQDFASFPTAKLDWWSQLKNFLIPTAYAQYVEYPIYAITFTLKEAEKEPAGASNILFIPGIMGSRLYEDSDVCEGEDYKTELWFSTDECKQMRLTTRFIGDSVNPIYTKGSDAGIVDDAFIFFNIYESFLESMADWKNEDLINEYAVLPYDWRMELDDILKSKYNPATGKTFTGQETSVTDGLLYKLITHLAGNSKSGKVTIVAHSNGGLVIKQLLSNLQVSNDPLLEKIDAVILVAVPQAGSMGSAIGTLHGEKLDFVMSQEVTRRLMNTMPFAHHLLPTQGYFDAVATPAIVFEPGVATEDWISQFGEEVTSQHALHNFLSKESGRTKPILSDLSTPEVMDPFLLQYAGTTEVVQNNFVPSPGMKVYQVAGTGFLTPSQLEYFTDKECVSQIFFICTEYAPKLGYRVKMTIDGDNTVSVPSALSLAESENVERWWINLKSYGRFRIDKVHKDIFEIAELSSYIKDTLGGFDGTYDYIYDVEPELDEGERLVFQLHSPLDLSIETVTGKVVSSSTNDIPGATYRRFGELQYISIPRSESLLVKLIGTGTGSFTIDVEMISAGGDIERQTYGGIPSSTSTKVQIDLSKDSDLQEIRVSVDYDGDGVVDVEYDESGALADEVTYEDLFQVIDEISNKRLPKTILSLLARTAERFNEKAVQKPKFKKQERRALKSVLKKSLYFKRLGFIDSVEQEKIESVVNKLLNL